jgi:hypothetical protein
MLHSLHRLASTALVVFALLVTLGSPAPAQQSAPVPPPPKDEILGLFLDTCLTKFPDDDALKATMASKKYNAMSPDQTARFLKSDPGLGWFVPTASGNYVLTLELPPYHACAIRRVYAKAPELNPAYGLLLATWTATLQGKTTLHASPPQTLTLAGKPPMVAMLYDMVRTGAPPEKLMAIVTSFPNGSQELRLVRQIPPPQ